MRQHCSNKPCFHKPISTQHRDAITSHMWSVASGKGLGQQDIHVLASGAPGQPIGHFIPSAAPA